MKTEKNKELDILLLVDNDLQVIGGAEKSTEIIIEGIKDTFSVGLLQPSTFSILNEKKSIPMSSKSSLKQLIKNPFSFLKYILNTKMIINKSNPKIIHTQAQASFFIIGLLRKLKLIPDTIKLIHTERGLYTKYGTLIRSLFLFLMNELNVLVTTTRFNKEYWENALENKGISIDYKIIENTAGEIFENYEDDLEKPQDGNLVIGFAGRYADWKNWPLAVEISKKLYDRIGKKMYVYMAIGCPDDKSKRETQDMFSELSKVIGSRFNGKTNLNFEEMNEFYYKLDVFILTSDYNTESFGRTLVEAMSRKTIVLTTNAGGSVEVVGNQNNVCNSAEEFVDKLLFYYYHSGKMQQEKEYNMQRVRDKYSLKNNINKHLKLYQKKYY